MCVTSLAKQTSLRPTAKVMLSRLLLIAIVLPLSISSEVASTPSHSASNHPAHAPTPPVGPVDMMRAVEDILTSTCKDGPSDPPPEDERTVFDLHWMPFVGLRPLFDRLCTDKITID